MGFPGGLRRLSSWQLGVCLAAVYLLVCGALGVVFLAVARPADTAARPAEPPPDSLSAPTGNASHRARVPITDPSNRSEPAGYRTVTGPAGTGTRIPAGWPVRAVREDTLEAADPATVQPSDRLVRYGGYPTTATDLLGERIAYEQGQFQRVYPTYQRQAMQQVRFHGYLAVLWEFEFDKQGVHRHVRALYWLAGGNEHLVYASSPAVDWPTMLPVYQQMVATATP
jgi:hypothetical protein